MPNIRLKRYTGVAWEDVEVQTDWSQILNKPSTFTPTSHTHGNLNNSGAITNSPLSVSSGDAIMVSSASGNTLQRTNLQFNSSGTGFLRQDGTWATAGGSDADTLDGYHETAFVRLSANSSSPTNAAFAIGNASSRNFIQSHNGQPLDINPLGNNVILNSGGGSVGIGTTSPADRLSIQDGNFRLFNTGGANPSIFLSNYNVSTTYPQVALVQSDAGVWGGNFSIQTKPNGASTNALSTRLFVQHDGSVGINTTSPSSNYKLDVNGETILRNWMTFNNNAFFGLYSQNNGAHFYPNNLTYGAWRVSGTRNGWGGLEFDTAANGNVQLMIGQSASQTGFHNNTYGWQFYWESGTLYTSKNSYGGATQPVLDASNYTSYAARVNATSTLQGGVKVRLSGTTLFITSNGNNA
jgi:hypothetical protein